VESARHRYELFVSQVVVDEVSLGDHVAVQERLLVVDPLPTLMISDDATELANDLLIQAALPKKAYNDALHIAIAATNKMHYLVTWNCKHIANATMRPMIQSICLKHGYPAPIICTPEQLRALEEKHD
jgi:hypothetical protein